MAEKKHFKDWHVILTIIVIISMATAGMLYAQKVGNDTTKKVEKLIPDVNYLEKCFEVDRTKQEGRYELLNNKIQNINDNIEKSNEKIDKLDSRFDDMIKLINEKLDGAIILTEPLKKEG